VTSTHPPAVVLGLNPNALGTVRSLRLAGIDVIAVDRRPASWRSTHTWMSSRTRACRKILLDSQAGDEELLAALRELGPTLPAPAPVLPSGDVNILFLQRHASSLSQWFRFLVPAHEVMDTLLDKRRFHDFAVQFGVPVPLTYAPLDRSTAADVSRRIRYPCFVKPAFRDDTWDHLFAPAKGFVAEAPEDLLRVVDRATDWNGSLLAQEIIPGGDHEIYFSHLYVDQTGRLRAVWTGRKLRQLPIHFGTATCAETTSTPEVEEYSLRLLRGLGCRGYSSFEFKRDSRDGAFRVIEPTVGRTWYPHYTGTVAGANLPALWYRDLAGLTLPEETVRARAGVRWVDEYRDLSAAFDYRRAAELTLMQWFRSLLGTRGFALAAWRDPLPILFVGLRLVISAWNAVRRALLGRNEEA